MRKPGIALCWLVVLALILTGCGRTTPTAEPPIATVAAATQAPPTAAPAPTDTPAPTATLTPAVKKVTVWHGWTGSAAGALDKVAAAFQDANPGIVVEMLAVPEDQLKSKFMADAQAGGGPDLVLGPLAWGAEFAQANLIQPLDELGSQIGLNNLDAAAINAGRSQGKAWAFPLTRRTTVLWYRTDKVKQAPQDTDELLKLAEGAGLGLGTSFTLASGLLPGKLLDDQGRCALEQGGAADALAFIQKAAAAKGVSADAGADTLGAAFMEGKVALVFAGTEAAADFQQALGADKLAVAAPLALKYGKPGGTYAPLLDTQNLFLSANSSGGRVLDFLSFVSQADVQRLFAQAGLVPANSKVKADDPLLAAFQKQMQSVSYLPDGADADAIQAAGDAMIGQVVGGKAKPADAVKEACAALEAALKR